MQLRIETQQHTSSSKIKLGTFLEVQLLRLCTSTARAMVQSLVGELRSHMLCDTSKMLKKKKKKKKKEEEEEERKKIKINLEIPLEVITLRKQMHGFL